MKLRRVPVDFEGKEVEVKDHMWVINAMSFNDKPRLVEIARYTQIPLKSNFAITVHKSQGQTFESDCTPRFMASWATLCGFVTCRKIRRSVSGQQEQRWILIADRVRFLQSKNDFCDENPSQLPRKPKLLVEKIQSV